MNEVRECCGLAYYEGNLYAAGGKNDKTFHKSLEMYNIQANTWTMKAPMNQVRSYCTVSTYLREIENFKTIIIMYIT